MINRDTDKSATHTGSGALTGPTAERARGLTIRVGHGDQHHAAQETTVTASPPALHAFGYERIGNRIRERIFVVLCHLDSRENVAAYRHWSV
jgi:hypothetical protein